MSHLLRVVSGPETKDLSPIVTGTERALLDDMSRTHGRKLNLFPLLIAGAVSLGVFVTLAASASSHPLSVRAEKIYAFDRKNPRRLPSHRIRTLSMTLAFHDYAGAEILLKEMERQIW